MFYSISETEEKASCEDPVDIAFVVDSSRPTSEDYVYEKDFVKKVARSFDISPNKSHASIVLLSRGDAVAQGYKFSTYDNSESFEEAVEHSLNGQTIIEYAVDAAKKVFRPEMPKILLVLTDGAQTGGKKASDLKEKFIALRKEGVRVYPIGIGTQIKREELDAMAESKDDVFVASDMASLERKLRNIVRKACGTNIFL